MTLKGGELTILDLNHELEKRLQAKATPAELKRLSKLQDSRQKQVEYNRKQGAVKRKLNKKLKEDMNELSKIQLKKRIHEINSLPKYDLSVIDNEMNRILKKNFKYIVQDGFNREAYSINVSKLMKKKNPAQFLLQRFRNKVAKTIKQEEEQGGIITGSIRGAQKLLSKIDENLRLLSLGMEEYEDEEKELDETNPPLIVDFIGEIIELNV